LSATQPIYTNYRHLGQEVKAADRSLIDSTLASLVCDNSSFLVSESLEPLQRHATSD